ncbi:phage protein [Streptococcus canis]|uniref:hypothetical protein n=1 Tax=Streptococcus canis TaxID=1329 RepID=UPI000C1B9313|nr:hypothetical protein [Streptococcus canis]HES2369691.1 hypothetical protein [Streptococcus pyogenes]MDV5988963.1 hypothetical protein [Streptococcus canis]VTS75405.1 phage protein [Streptococcus canis]GAY70495.1 phage protein [Streptococcus canis]GAY71732.1 phage protein [Streptococcus canis]
MKKYIEFKDEWKSATDHLNDFIEKNKYAKVTVVGYQVIKNSPCEKDRTYILAEVGGAEVEE